MSIRLPGRESIITEPARRRPLVLRGEGRPRWRNPQFWLWLLVAVQIGVLLPQVAALVRRPHHVVSPLVAPAAAARGRLEVTIANGTPAFVYLDGGSLLGRTPLRGTLRAGHYRLVLWSPQTRARAVREVDVRAGDTMRLSVPLVRLGRAP